MARFSGRSSTGILLGYVSASTPEQAQGNWPNATIQLEADDFSLTPGEAQWNGVQWVPVRPPPSPLVTALDQLLNSSTPTITQVINVLRVWRQRLS